MTSPSIESGARERTRRAILDAAMLVLADHPTAALGDIAAAAGVGRSTVHRYYPERTDLLRALARHVHDLSNAAIERADPTSGPVDAALRRVVESQLDLGPIVLFVYYEPSILADPELAAYFDIGDEAIVEVLNRASTERPEYPPGWARRVFWALMQAGYEAAKDRHAASPDRRRHHDQPDLGHHHPAAHLIGVTPPRRTQTLFHTPFFRTGALLMSTCIEGTPSTTRTPTRAWVALAVLALPVLLIAIDNTVLAFALPLIAEDFRPSATTQLWIVDVYSLVLAALLVAMGSLGDRLGRRRLLLIGGAGFAVVSALAAFAPSAELLVGARALLGVFGAMLMPSTLSLIRNIFTDASARRLAIAIWASCFTAGSALGPIVGGALLEHFHWGAVFLVAVPILLPLLVLGPRLVPESRDPNPGPFDPVSIVLSFTTMLPIVWAVKTAAHDGLSAAAAAAFAVGIVSGALFVRRQNRSATPMLDIGLFKVMPFTSSILANFLSIIGLIGFIFFISQHLQLVLGLSPLTAGLVTLPGAVVSMIAGLAVVKAAKRFAPDTLMVTGLVFVAVGFLMILLFRHNLTVAAIIASFVVLELGVGVSQTVSNDTIVASVPAAKSGAASAVSETAYELGAVVGTATLGTIFTAFYRSNVDVPAGLTPEQTGAAAESIGGAAAVAADLPAATATQLLDSARAAFDSGIAPTAVIAAMLVLAAAAVVGVAFRR